MFDSLSGKLSGVFDRLRRRGALNEEDVSEALREIRLALLDADVALPVVKDFIAEVRSKAVGAEVLRSVSPGQMVVKIVNDALVEALGGTAAPLNLLAPAPLPILMVGLQGSGKTTTSGKIALRLRTRERKKVLLASLDTQRPAAQLQLEQLAQRAEVTSLPIIPGQTPLQIANRAMDTARREIYDVVILDTAGRLSIDLALMEEVKAIRQAVNPVETLLVVDAMTGQDAVSTATAFNDALGITGIVMTRLDGDSRGGAALSMRKVTGAPIKLVGLGEKLDALDNFDPERVAGRILGMGDIVGLVERAAETIDKDEAEKLAKKMAKGKFDLEDYASQLKQISKMGSLSGILGMLPGDRQAQAADRGRQSRHHHVQAPGRDHRFDDGRGTAQSRHPQGQPQEAHRGRLRHLGAGGQQAAEAVRRHVDHDEADEQDGRPAGDDAPDAGRHGATQGRPPAVLNPLRFNLRSIHVS